MIMIAPAADRHHRAGRVRRPGVESGGAAVILPQSWELEKANPTDFLPFCGNAPGQVSLSRRVQSYQGHPGISDALAVGETSADLVGSERVRRHPHRRARSAPPCGVSRGPRAYRVRVPINSFRSANWPRAARKRTSPRSPGTRLETLAGAASDTGRSACSRAAFPGIP